MNDFESSNTMSITGNVGPGATASVAADALERLRVVEPLPAVIARLRGLNGAVAKPRHGITPLTQVLKVGGAGLPHTLSKRAVVKAHEGAGRARLIIQQTFNTVQSQVLTEMWDRTQAACLEIATACQKQFHAVHTGLEANVRVTREVDEHGRTGRHLIVADVIRTFDDVFTHMVAKDNFITQKRADVLTGMLKKASSFSDYGDIIKSWAEGHSMTVWLSELEWKSILPLIATGVAGYSATGGFSDLIRSPYVRVQVVAYVVLMAALGPRNSQLTEYVALAMSRLADETFGFAAELQFSAPKATFVARTATAFAHFNLEWMQRGGISTFSDKGIKLVSIEALSAGGLTLLCTTDSTGVAITNTLAATKACGQDTTGLTKVTAYRIGGGSAVDIAAFRVTLQGIETFGKQSVFTVPLDAVTSWAVNT